MSIVLTTRQRAIARGIIRAAKIRYAHEPVAVQRLAAKIALNVGFAEAGLKVLASANVPASLNYPHDRLDWSYDGLGHDHASCGLFQQQTGCAWCANGCGTAMNQSTMGSPDGWGTPAQLMDPQTSTALFFKALDRRAPNWRTQKAWWVSAQNVQGSAFDGNPRPANNYSSVYGGNYKSQRAKGYFTVNLLWPAATTKPTPPAPAPKPVVKPRPKPTRKPVYFTVRPGWYLGRIAAHYGTTWQHLVQLNRAKYPTLATRPDYVAVGWRLRVK